MVAVVDDPILARRAQFARWAERGQRAGYGCLAVAVVAFVVAVAAGFPGPTVAIVIAGLIGATLTLPPSIIFGYAVKAAEREDRELMDRQQANPPHPAPRTDG